MQRQWSYFLFLVLFSYLMISSVLLFNHGFLLTRESQPNVSTCEQSVTCEGSVDNEKQQCSEKEFISNLDINLCFPKQAKVVLLIIDAFRYDFALYNKSFQDPLPYQNKMPVIQELLDKFPERTRLMEFIADPPTTTMQRLKALTTGSLPTFIDASSNFGSAEINEDNLIYQLAAANKNITFMGDDTWMALYPNSFKKNFPYPSFNVKDLDTVDNGVRTHLYKELENNDFDLLIGHFLGVDHCGHRYGPVHEEMARKLTEMNEVIRKVSNVLPENTILFVIGDHGMTNTGDHGGESQDEVKAAIFIYSTIHLSPSFENIISKTVKQVDLVPTLAYILGVPIPFSNLGTTILDALPGTKNLEKMQLSSMWSNLNQLYLYIKEYSRTASLFNKEMIEDIEGKYNKLKIKLKTIESDEISNFIEESFDLMKTIRQMCEKVWVQFNSFSMSRGLLLMSMSIFFVFLMSVQIPHTLLPGVLSNRFILYSFLGIVIASLLCFLSFKLNFLELLLPNVYFSTGLLLIIALCVVIIRNFEKIAENFYKASKIRNLPKIFCRLILVLSACILFSNSFIVEEANVLMFLSISAIFVVVFDVAKPKTKSKGDKLPFKKTIKAKAILFAIIICVLVRTSFNYIRCREEQPWCKFNTHTVFKNSSFTSKAEWVITLLSLGLLVTFSRMWLRSCGNLVGSSITIFLARYVPTVLVVCTGGYWVLQRLPNTRNNAYAQWQSNSLAKVVYGTIILGILSTILKPLCIYILPKQNNITADSSSNVIPQLFQQVKDLFELKKKDQDDVPIVCGLATAYSSVYIVLSVYIAILLALLLGDALAPSIVIMFFCAAITLAISSLSRFENATTIDDMLNVPNSSVLTWVMLSLYFFFATGHQPTFPNIAWNAAFVGTSGEFENNFIPGTLIILNTFSSHLFFGINLPLLQIAPFALFVMMQSWFKKPELLKVFSRGELLLYENESMLMDQTFKLCCRYILCHGIRVFASMLTATIHCRHLMVWAIFAPKFIFESLGLFVTIASVLVGYLILVRVNYMLDRFVKCLNDRSR